MRTRYAVKIPADQPYAVECEDCGEEDAVVYGCYENRYGELCEEALCATCLKERDNDD
jgi:hypothetical protein